MTPHLILQQPTCEVGTLPPCYRYKHQDLKKVIFSGVFHQGVAELGVTDLFIPLVNFSFFFFLVSLHSLQDLSSLTRD